MKPNRLRTPQSVDEWAEQYMIKEEYVKSKKSSKSASKSMVKKGRC